MERSIGRGGPAAGDHVRLSVPEPVRTIVREITIDRAQALPRPPSAVLVVEELPALDEIFVVGVDPAADVAGAARPVSCFDVDLFADEPRLRPTPSKLRERAFRLLEEDRFVREPRERAELEN